MASKRFDKKLRIDFKTDFIVGAPPLLNYARAIPISEVASEKMRESHDGPQNTTHTVEPTCQRKVAEPLRWAFGTNQFPTIVAGRSKLH